MTPSDSTSPTQTDSESGFLLRWRGKQEGPFSLADIERRIAANEVGLLHEIHYEGDWMPIRKFLELRAVQEEAARRHQAETLRLAREQEERDSREREAQQRNELLAEEKRKNDLLEAAVRNQQSEPDASKTKSGSGAKGIGAALLIAGIIIGLFVSILFGAIIAIVGLALMMAK